MGWVCASNGWNAKLMSLGHLILSLNCPWLKRADGWWNGSREQTAAKCSEGLLIASLLNGNIVCVTAICPWFEVNDSALLWRLKRTDKTMPDSFAQTVCVLHRDRMSIEELVLLMYQGLLFLPLVYRTHLTFVHIALIGKIHWKDTTGPPHAQLFCS